MSSTRAGLEANATPFTAATVIPRPIFLDDKDQDVDEHPLHCSICCDVSFDPVITPCQHVFCRECITSGLQNNPSCPNDRRALNANSLRNVSGIHEYVYNRTLVKCPRCDTWSGKMQQYKEHVANCTSSIYVQTLERKVQQLQITNDRWEATLDQERRDAEEGNGRLESIIAQERQYRDTLSQQHAEETERLQSKIEKLVNEVSTLGSRIESFGPRFDSSYRYDEDDAVVLSRVISRNLHNKPNNIDSNRIFNCIKRCYDGTLRYHSDDHWKRVAVVMLLFTCLHSNWFSPNQGSKIEEWCRDIPW